MLKVTVVVHGDGDRIKSKIKKKFAQEARNIPPGPIVWRKSFFSIFNRLVLYHE